MALKSKQGNEPQYQNGYFLLKEVDFVIVAYEGKLIELDNVVLTSHIGSYTDTCRTRMELEAIEDIIRFIKGKRMINLVPECEYEKSSLW